MAKSDLMEAPVIITERLKLCPWRSDHLAAFADMHADPEVMADQGGPIGFDESAEKFDRYEAAYREHGVSRWAVEDAGGAFLGYAGVMRRSMPGHPLGPHHEIGWRFVRDAWGKGYASESARAALGDAFARLGLEEVLSYTHPSNIRSQALMARLGLTRAPDRDFVADYEKGGPWQGMVWTTSPDDWRR